MIPRPFASRHSTIDLCRSHHQITTSPNHQIPGIRHSPFDIRHSRAFTLVEMLVVIAIIALLLAALLPAFGAVRNQAKIAATKAQFGSIDTGIATYRGENALGGALPPSSSDNNTTADRKKIANPKGSNATNPIRVGGAHLLVQALMGADGLGTPGFKDLDRDGTWWDDTFGGPPIAANANPKGLYSTNSATGESFSPRYGPYVDDKLREKATSIKQLSDDGKIVTDLADLANTAIEEPLFVDAWNLPILYYKANPSALRMVADLNGNQPGIYTQEDNAIITGSEKGGLDAAGLDFGTGAHAGHEADQPHWVHDATAPPAAPTTTLVAEIAETDPQYDHTFARFIIDPSIKARPTPVRKESYLLISAGPDSIYGSDDDVLNWERKTE